MQKWIKLRLTNYQGRESNPKISPDRKTIVFTGEYDGNTDIYTTSIEGGAPVRMTWPRGADIMSNWSEDGSEIIFNSNEPMRPIQITRNFGRFPLKVELRKGS